MAWLIIKLKDGEGLLIDEKVELRVGDPKNPRHYTTQIAIKTDKTIPLVILKRPCQPVKK